MNEKTYMLTFSFNGTRYAGWQNQPDQTTVQSTMEYALRNLLKDQTLFLSGCSRTDAGVHAVGMTASFRTEQDLCCDTIRQELNKRLPHDIRIDSVQKMPPRFLATETCGKAYVYVINTGAENLFLSKCCWSWTEENPDLDAVRRALTALEGEHVFRSFTGRKDATSLKPRTVWKAELHSFGPLHCFYFSGSGFLHKMIRRVVGCLHAVATGEMSVETFRNAVTDPETILPDFVAPPRGLYLQKVFYNTEDAMADTLDCPPCFK